MAQSVYPGNYGGSAAVGSRVRWGAVFAGVVTGMVMQVLLGLLGLAIGLNAFDPAQESYAGLGVGSALWLVLSALISAFVGGWVASSLANVSTRLDGLMHGVLSWGVLMVIAAYLLGTGLGTIVGGAFNLTSAALTGASQGVAQRTQGVAAVREQAQNLEQQTRQMQAQAGRTRTDEVRTEQAADRAAGATWGTFIVALLSLLASAFGGLRGLKVSDYRQEIVT